MSVKLALDDLNGRNFLPVRQDFNRSFYKRILLRFVPEDGAVDGDRKGLSVSVVINEVKAFNRVPVLIAHIWSSQAWVH